MLSDKAYDLLRALLEPSRPNRGRAFALTGVMGWRELTDPAGKGLSKNQPYRLSVSGTLASSVLFCITNQYVQSALGAWHVPSAPDIAGAFAIPVDGVEYCRTWPEDEGFRVFICAENAAALGTANCRLHAMAPGGEV